MRCALLTLFVGLTLAPSAAGQDQPLRYPPARRVEVVDEYHGQKISDPYRWMETDLRQSPEVAAWAQAQNEITSQYLAKAGDRDAIRKRLQTLWNYPRYSPPTKAGKRYVFAKNDGLQNQAVLYVADALDAEPKVLLDPNAWSKDGSVALAALSFSDDGATMAYGVSEAGADWQTWHLMDIASRKILADELRWLKFDEPAWTADNRGFYYCRYPEPKAEEQFQQLNVNHKVYYHRIGTTQSDDALVYERTDHPEWSFSTYTTDDGHYLILFIRKADDEHFRIVYRDLRTKDAKFVELIDNFDNQYYFVGSQGDEFYLLTDRDSPRRRLVAIDLSTPKPADWRTIVPQGAEAVTQATFIGGRFLLSSLKDASTRVRVFDASGAARGEIPLPSIGTALGFRGRQADTETFYSFASYTTPSTIYRYDISAGQSSVFRRSTLAFNPDDYQVEQVFVTSRDGTRIPMFLSSKKGLKRDGSNPTLLYGYGGFGISITPSFSASNLAWMEMGGAYAVATLRGGGEYGEAWHAAGAKTNKQNVFDDFIASAQWLIDNKVTRSDRLAIDGASNGGLLVAAVMIQRPELFGACIAQVPVTDMLRFHRYTDGRFWVTDYGSVEDAAEFRALLAYSPYHNVKPGTKFPPTLIMTADTDDRVVPMHSFKFAAAVQQAQAGNAPILLRVATRGGHGAGKAVSSRIEEVADMFAFLQVALHMR